MLELTLWHIVNKCITFLHAIIRTYIHTYMGMYILVMEVTGLKAVLKTESY